MDFNKQKEQFSIAYVRAVIATARFNIYKPEVDDDSIDLGIAASGSLELPVRPRLELQLKCTADEGALREGIIQFRLKVKNYNDLRLDALVPRALVVVLVPSRVDDWLTQSEEQLVMRKCGYWLSLLGEPEVENTETIAVQVPRTQQFTPAALQGIMTRINNGGPI